MSKGYIFILLNGVAENHIVDLRIGSCGKYAIGRDISFKTMDW